MNQTKRASMQHPMGGGHKKGGKMGQETLYLVEEETSPNGRFTHLLKHKTAGELYNSFAGNSAEECEAWAFANGYHIEYGAPDLPTRLDIALRAWDDVGDCELSGWERRTGNIDSVTDHLVAYGKPPRARHEYHYVFVFRGRWIDGGYANVLVSILRAPWHETIRWRGGFPNNRKHLYKHFDNPTYAML